MIPVRLFSNGRLEEKEKLFIESCNQIKHKLLVVGYLSGDDRDHWYLKCTECSANISYHLSFDEPYLNYCPNCSNPKELESFDESDLGIDAYTGEKLPCIENCQDTPEYKSDSAHSDHSV